LFDDITVCARGMTVAGAPIGDDAFCADFVGVKVDDALAELQTLLGITLKSGFTCSVCMPQLNYLFRLRSPPITSAFRR
jgi:hypothetical protein